MIGRKQREVKAEFIKKRFLVLPSHVAILTIISMAAVLLVLLASTIQKTGFYSYNNMITWFGLFYASLGILCWAWIAVGHKLLRKCSCKGIKRI